MLSKRRIMFAKTGLRCICCVCKCTNRVSGLLATPEQSKNPCGTEVSLGKRKFRRWLKISLIICKRTIHYDLYKYKFLAYIVRKGVHSDLDVSSSLLPIPLLRVLICYLCIKPYKQRY